jgi:phage N-6-adenine-methyltransferase
MISHNAKIGVPLSVFVIEKVAYIRYAKMSNDECHTPNDFFGPLDSYFHFKLDAAATARNAKCKRFLTKKDNALECPWKSAGYVWCNPPFSREGGGILRWLEKAHHETYELENCAGAVVLSICDVSTKAFAFAWKHAHELVFLSPRINFPSPGKTGRSGGLQAYYLAVFTQDAPAYYRSLWKWKDVTFDNRDNT